MQNFTRLVILFILAGLLYPSDQVFAKAESDPNAPLTTRTGRVRFSYEQLDMPKASETLGLLGFSYLFDIADGFYGGLGGYGALAGDRGGFFTGGIESGYRRKLLGPLQGEIGLFVGGGGGGSAPQGGGLMLRPHVGLGLSMNDLEFSLGYSKVKFPNGEIDSDQIMVSLDIPFTSLQGPKQGRGNRISAEELGLGRNISLFGYREDSLTLSAWSYFPTGSPRATSGRKLEDRLDLIGFEYRRFISPGGFFLTQFGGALGGAADGYAEILFGGGYRFSLKEGRGLEGTASLAMGGAGGGAVDTGGGTLGRAALSLGWRFNRDIAASLEGGYVSALDGEFDALSAGVKLAYSLESVVPGRGVRSGNSADSFRLAGWQVRASHQSYLKPQRKTKNNRPDDVQLIAAKADLMVNRRLYLTAQAAGAYDGDAGGYATGLVGIGMQSDPFLLWGLRCSGEILAGAAGGGGMAVGDGAIVQPMLGLTRDLGESFTIQAHAGRVMAISGDLDATVVDFGVAYRFTTPVLNRRQLPSELP